MMCSNATPTPVDSYECSKCMEKIEQPIVLSCLHVYCMDCLQKQVEEKLQDDKQCNMVECPKCHHETQIPINGLSDLTPEYVLIDLMVMSDTEDLQIFCTSCKGKIKAVARCQDCACFLCTNCFTAHQFMHYFDNHKVISFEAMKKAEPPVTHLPIFCTSHPSENLKNYCKTCEVPVCNDCIASDHKPPEHQTESVCDLEESEREYLSSLIQKCRNKVSSGVETIALLMDSMTELRSQRENAKDLINESSRRYKAILEKIQNELLTQLDFLKLGKERSLMNLGREIESAARKLQDGCQITKHILNNSSGLQLLQMKKVITSHLSSLINSVPNTEIPERPLSSLHSSFENEGFLQPSILSPDTTIMPPVQPDYEGMPPISIPNSIGDLGLQSLAIERRSLSRNLHSPAMSDSDISVDAGSTNSSSSTPQEIISALAKLGTVGYSSQGMGGVRESLISCRQRSHVGSDLMSAVPENSYVTFNGHVLPRLKIENTTGIQPVSNRGATPTSDSGLSPGQPPQTPNLETSTVDPYQGNAGVLENTSMDSFGLASGGNSAPGNITPTFSPTGYVTFNGHVLPRLKIENTTGIQPVSNRGATPTSDSGLSPGQPPQTPNLETSTVDPYQGNAGVLENTSMDSFGLASGGNSAPGNITPTFSPTDDNLADVQRVGRRRFCEDLTDYFIPPRLLSDRSNSQITIGSGLNDAYMSNRPVKSAMQIRCRFGKLGWSCGQFNSPNGFCLGINEDIVVADTINHRIEVFEKLGMFKYQFGIRGNIAVVDSLTPTVVVITEDGKLLKWLDCTGYMKEPSDIAISRNEFFVCDFKGFCVVVFDEEGRFQRRIGGESITNYPNGIDISDAGDVVVGDSHGNRFHVVVFRKDGSLVGEFECPSVKISRCCRLKVTLDGHVVTLAKNNHHVLVFNTLYVSTEL